MVENLENKRKGVKVNISRNVTTEKAQWNHFKIYVIFLILFYLYKEHFYALKYSCTLL